MTNLASYLKENNMFVFVIVYLSFLLDNVLLTVVGKLKILRYLLLFIFKTQPEGERGVQVLEKSIACTL